MGIPASNQRNIKKHVSVEWNVRLPGLLHRVECIPALIACMVMNNALSTYSLALAIF
jgi:hypothetical protein